MIHRPDPICRQKGFTLTEVIVSIALAMILLLGISFVFKQSANTVGTGYALGEAYRSMQATQTQLYNDLEGYNFQNGGVTATTGILPSSQLPFLLIHSEQTTGYDNANNETNNINGGIVGKGTYRLDTLAFFSQGSFRRQTGQTNYVANMSPMQYAYIWYGHLNQIGKFDGTKFRYYYPGQTSFGAGDINSNNLYASQFCLGRVAVPMISPLTPAGASYFIFDLDGISQNYVGSESGTSPGVPAFSNNSFYTKEGSLSLGSFFQPLTTSSASAMQYYDLAAFPYGAASQYTSDMAGYRSQIKDYEKANVANWYTSFLNRFDANATIIGNTTNNTNGPNADSASMNLMAPRLQEGCSQFIVEFAGDFITQEVNTGKFVSGAPDGTVDYNLDANGNRSIRWYGMPRQVSAAEPSLDVNTIAGWTSNAYTPRFESYVGGVYTCAFGPVEFDTAPRAVKPSLIRIIIQVVDENGRLTNGVSQEFVFKVP